MTFPNDDDRAPAEAITAEDLKPPVYDWERPFKTGWNDGYILGAKDDKWPSGDKVIDLVCGLPCPSGQGFDGLGVKITMRVSKPSEDLRQVLALLQPELLKSGGVPDYAAWRNRPIKALVVEEVDKKRSREQGTEVRRAKIRQIAARDGVQAAPAPAATPTAPRGGAFA